MTDGQAASVVRGTIDPALAAIHPRLPEVIRRIVEIAKLERIILFGSAARGLLGYTERAKEA